MLFLQIAFLFGKKQCSNEQETFFLEQHKELLYCVQREHMANETAVFEEGQGNWCPVFCLGGRDHV